MAPLDSELLSSNENSPPSIWILSLLTTLVVSGTLLAVWLICACCHRGAKKNRPDDRTHDEQSKPGKSSPGSRHHKSMSSQSSVSGVSASRSDKSFPTVFRMQIPRSSKRQKSKSVEKSIIDKLPIDCPATPVETEPIADDSKSSNQWKESFTLHSVSVLGQNNSQLRSVSVIPSSLGGTCSVSVQTEKEKSKETSSSSFKNKIPASLTLAIILGSLFSSSAVGNTIDNKTVVGPPGNISRFANDANRSTSVSNRDLEPIAAADRSISNDAPENWSLRCNSGSRALDRPGTIKD